MTSLKAKAKSKQATKKLTRAAAKKVLTVVDAGLVNGLGIPTPGKMCVEAAVCYALGLPHGDKPDCVAPILRNLKIRLNDSSWSSPSARAKGLRRLALAQLGSAGALDEKEFRKRIVDYALRVSTSQALRSAAAVCQNADHKQKFLDAANKCEVEGSRKAAQEALSAANAAYAAANAAYAAANAAANAAYAAANAAANANAADAAANAANAAYAAAYAADAAANAAAAAAAAANAANAAAAAAAAANAAYAAANAAANAAAANAAANAAYAAAYAAAANARDKALSEYAEAIVGFLISMKAPGTQWLDLAPLEASHDLP